MAKRWSKKEINDTFEYICDCIELYGESIRTLLLKKTSPLHPKNTTKETKETLDIKPPKRLPALKDFYKWLDADKEKAERYVRACDERTEALFDDIYEIARQAESDRGSVSKARLEIDAIKWVIGKQKPKKYGEVKEVLAKEDDRSDTLLKAPTKVSVQFKDFSGEDPEAKKQK